MSIAVRTESSAADPAALLPRSVKRVRAGALLRLQVGDAVCEVEGDLASGVIGLLEAVGAGLSVDITALPPELTTGQAADVLGVSRPTVVALVDKELLAATHVGTHRRLRTLDVLTYRDHVRKDRRVRRWKR